MLISEVIQIQYTVEYITIYVKQYTSAMVEHTQFFIISSSVGLVVPRNNYINGIVLFKI